VAASPPPLRFAFPRFDARQPDEYATVPSAATLQCSMQRLAATGRPLRGDA